MTITATINRTNGNNRRQFREIIQLFIEGKMSGYNGIKVSLNYTEDSIAIERGK